MAQVNGPLTGMDLQLLGPVEATIKGRPIPLGATKQRAVLAMLALRANRTVSVDRLVDGLWGEDPPATAPKMVQLYVSQLRRLLAGDGAQIVTHGRGYELKVAADAVDAARFESLVELAGRRGRAPNDAAREALALWQGAPLADVAEEPFAAAEIRRLDELWLRAMELAIEGELTAGRHEEVLPELERLAQEHPLRERLHAQRMLALYRSGRQADALEAYGAARRRLVDEVGVEPGAELRDLQTRILRQDPSLQLPARRVDIRPARREAAVPAERRRGRPITRRHILVAAAASFLLGIAVFAITRLTGADRLPGIDAAAVGVIDPSAVAVKEQYRTGSEPGTVAGGAGSVWVASPGDGTVSRIHREEDRQETIDVGPAPTDLAFGAGALWVAGEEDGAVAQVDPATNRVVQRIRVGNGLRAVAVGYGAVWAATALDGEVARIDLRSGRVTKRIAVAGQPAALAAGAGAVWAAAEEAGTVTRIDPRSGEALAAVAVGNGPSDVAVGLGAVWSANRQDGTVSRIDPGTNRVTDTVRAGRAPAALAIADGAVFVADASGAILRLDPRTRGIAERLRTGSTPVSLAAVDGSIWAPAAAPLASHRGGTLHVGGLPPTFDPADFNPGAFSFVELLYDGLVAYRRVGGTAGARLVASLAADVPKPADGGHRYVFRLRPGLRYSDGRRVKAGDFRASLERLFVINGSQTPSFFDAIEGIPRCRRTPRSCDLSRGIATDERSRTITIRLRRPDPSLLQNLQFAAVVPADTPLRRIDARPPPGTGPYRVERVTPGHRALLVRNPHFRPRSPDDRPAGFADRVAVTSLPDERAEIAAVERGRLDLANVFDATAEGLAGLRTRFGTRLRSAATAFTELAWLNVRRPPFDDPRVRRALNLAVDRRRVVEVTGGEDAGSPTCQLLPPGFPGYRPVCRFTLAPSRAGAWTAPDRQTAKRLVAASGARGTPVEVWAWPPRRAVGRHLAAVLRDLGFRSRARVFADLGPELEAAMDPRQSPQIGLNGWLADSPAPASFLRALVGCGEQFNLGRFCDHGIDAAIDRAQAGGSDAGAAWQRIERRIAERAPVVPLTSRRLVVVMSRRAGGIQFHPLYHVLLDRVWVQ